MKIIENYDYILSVGAFFEDEEFRNSLKKAIKNSAIFDHLKALINDFNSLILSNLKINLNLQIIGIFMLYLL